MMRIVDVEIKIPQLPWYGNTEMEFRFSLSWAIFFRLMKGVERKRLTHEQKEKAFLNPFGSIFILELAKRKKEIVILFDEMARCTPILEILPYKLKEVG